MRALAHPLRLALMEALLREGQLTATQAAELLGDSPGNMSWHLQTLARYGFVEEADGGHGRSRPWQRKARSMRFSDETDDPELATAATALGQLFHERRLRRLDAWLATRQSFSLKWRREAFVSEQLTYLTAEELGALGEEITALLLRYRDRVVDRSLRPEGALPVSLVAFGHPLPPSPTGN